jgi:hypothetical protein
MDGQRLWNRERQQLFRVAVRTADPGKARAGVAAVEVAVDDFTDDRPEIPAFPLEAPLVFDEVDAGRSVSS